MRFTYAPVNTIGCLLKLKACRSVYSFFPTQRMRLGFLCPLLLYVAARAEHLAKSFQARLLAMPVGASDAIQSHRSRRGLVM